MEKAKRMSDIFASSAEKETSGMTATATPYSSEGPTLPIIGADTERSANDTDKARITNDQETNRAQPVPTIHSSLYEPWTLLPNELVNLLTLQARLRGTQNIVPVVFTKNQNVKSGINRLKTYLGAYKDEIQPMDIPEALTRPDAIIAVSAQGDGTAKLVSILDVARRVVAPSIKEKKMVEEIGTKINTWWLYTSLTSVEVEKKARVTSGANDGEKLDAKVRAKQINEDSEDEAFEPMDVDMPVRQKEQRQKKKIKAPVLTVWLTKNQIPAFKDAFGEQSFEVKSLPQDD
ncbi:hypothetical protein BDU57DRAFT_526595 [Ampelomyces quisqualis]|uniref:DNA/RNA-binding protein Alba-like domain-containing protein n=1 Tax=Ampelomyces quisqualis TaxID=50730 RepID=A0A6A5R377_AMPQU|nr:hypothetical protein BDU57DRAFT_526595 [Ampelomyces quisqualis]